jgi:HK97 gp10 family phage protein
MPSEHIEVDDRAFRAGFAIAIEELRALAEGSIEHVADTVVDRAKVLVPKRTGRLADSIRRGQLVRTGRGAEVQVTAGGPGIRETVFVEFGTSKMRPEPYMRPALAEAAGALRSLGVAARLASSTNAREALRRARQRQRVRRATIRVRRRPTVVALAALSQERSRLAGLIRENRARRRRR